MRSKVVKILALALVLCSVSISSAQQQGQRVRVEEKEEKTIPRAKQKAAPEKSKLEEMLAEALKNNPDIRVAAAKLAEAGAELDRTRLQVMQKVATLYHAIETQKINVARWESGAKRLSQESKRGIVDPGVLTETEGQLALAKGKLAELEVQLPALLGKMPQAEKEVIATIKWHFAGKMEAPKTADPMTEKIRKTLRTPVKVDYKNMDFDAILKDLAKKVPGLSFRNRFPTNDVDKFSLRFEETLPVSAILQALADESRYSFYVREYAIMVAMKEHAPPGAMTVEEFLRQKPAEK